MTDREEHQTQGHTHLQKGASTWVDQSDLLILARGGESAAVCVEGHGQNHI